MSSTPARINVRFEVTIDPAWAPSYNVAPGTNVLIIHADAGEGSRIGEAAYWGFTPPWHKAGKPGPRPINARAEGLAGKPMFRNAFAKRRCIVAADGFYEWKALDHGKQPWLIRRRDGDVFGFAGIFEAGNETTGNRPSCAIVTTSANRLMQPIHDRMPVILHPYDYSAWLDPQQQETARLEQLLRPYAGDDLVTFPVSTRVNNAKNNDSALILPVDQA